MLEPPLRLLCFEYRRRLSGGLTRPVLVAAMDEDGREYEVVLKVRQPDVKEGHYEGTSLACELIAAVLARAAGTPVPDYAVVEIPTELAPAIPDRSVRALFANNIGDNFGSIYEEGLALWDPNREPRSPVLVDGLEDALTFDATVINGDRKRQKPNLLWRGENLLMIDHSLALPVHLWQEEDIDKSPLFPESEVVQHCAFHGLAGKGREFTRATDVWAAEVGATELQRLRGFIPSNWERRRGDLDRIFRFLEARPGRFTAISADLRRVVS